MVRMKKRIIIYLLLIVNLLIISFALSDFGKKIIWNNDQKVEEFQANELERKFFVQ